MGKINRADFRYFFPLAVRWGDLDALGHVNNTVFFKYAEEGRLKYFLEVGLSTPSMQESGLILADIRCSFLQQLQYPADVELATRTSALGTSSMHFEQALFHQGSDDAVARFNAVAVWFNYKKQTTVPVPEAVRRVVREYEGVAPEE